MKRILFCICLLLFITQLYAQALPLPIDQAFKLTIVPQNQKTVLLQWRIAPNYYLYQDRFNIELLQPNNSKLLPINFPKAISMQDEILGKYFVYQDTLNLLLRFQPTNLNNYILKISYQGCAASGFCYAPVTRYLQINKLPISSAQDWQWTTESNLASTTKSAPKTTLLSSNFFISLFSFFGFGILLAFTPCVLPLLPILASIIAQQKQQSLHRDFLLALLYVLGMATVLAMIGLIAGFMGANLQIYLQQPIFIAAMIVLLILFSFSMFGWLNIKIPQSLQQIFNQLNSKQGMLGIFLMGAFSTLIISPCVTPPLAGALLYILNADHPYQGSALLFMLGLGMGAPLLLVGAGMGAYLPKAGQWMEHIKIFFGFLLLAVAAWLAERILPMFWVFGFAAVVCFALSAYCFKYAKKFFTYLFALIVFSIAIVYVIAALTHGESLFSPLSHVAKKQQQSANFILINNESDLQKQLMLAQREKQYTLLEFYADWCVSCQLMKRHVWSDPTVQQALKNYRLLKVDITNITDAQQQMMQILQIVAPPTILFFDPNGNEITNKRIVGEVSKDQFLKLLPDLND